MQLLQLRRQITEETPNTDGKLLAIASRYSHTVKASDIADVSRPNLLRE